MLKTSLLSLMMLVMLSVNVSAQKTRQRKPAATTQKADSLPDLQLRGCVLDATMQDSLPGVHVRLINDKGETAKMTQTADNGQYTLTDIPLGRYTIRFTCMGFHEESRVLNITRKSGFLMLGNILMQENSTLMKEAVVEGQMAEMTVSDDTLVYNADAFKVQEGDMVEELVKKLPGVEVDDNGKYTMNGRPITQILVDGKEFFGRNMQNTLENLPADMVDKIKAYDRQSDMARISGIDDGEEKMVLDLTIKKNRKQGWMSNLQGGYGTQDRMNGKVMVSRFVRDQKVTLVGNTGNTGGNGNTTSGNIGLTQNYERKDLIQINGGLQTNLRKSESETESSIESFENKLAAFQQQERRQTGHSRNVHLQYKAEWTPDTLTTIIISPNFQWGKGNDNGRRLGASMTEDPFTLMPDLNNVLQEWDLLPRDIKVNRRTGASHGSQKNVEAGGNIQANRRLGKPGRNLAMNVSAGFQKGNSDSQNYSQTDYYRVKAVTGEDSVYQKTQFNNSDNMGRNASARISYTEPVGRQIYLQASYQYSWKRNARERNVSSIFGRDNLLGGVTQDNYREMGHLSTPDTAQQGRTENIYQNHNINLQLRIVRPRYLLSFGGMVQPQKSAVDYTKGVRHYEVTRSVINASPTLNFKYRFSKKEQFNARYHANTGQPSITDLIPDTLNNADPLNIRLGNPELKPSFTQTIHADYRKNIPELQRTYAANIDFHTTQNSVSSRTEYDELTGGRVTTPQNVNGNWDISGGFNFNTAIRGDKRFRVNTNTQGSMTNAVGYVYRSKLAETVKNRTRGASVRQGLRFTYRIDWLEVNANGSFRYNHTSSTSSSAGNMDTYRFNYGGSIQIDLPWNMKLSTNIDEQCRRGYANANMNTDELIWGFQISQSLLPKKALVISLRAVDVLNNHSDISRTITTTSRTDTRTSTVNSYFLATVSYRFRQFGGGSGKKGTHADTSQKEKEESGKKNPQKKSPKK
ncbi:MAG: outer membrane beta-barrel protein [Bacteroidaceae bacterium]